MTIETNNVQPIPGKVCRLGYDGFSGTEKIKVKILTENHVIFWSYDRNKELSERTESVSFYEHLPANEYIANILRHYCGISGSQADSVVEMLSKSGRLKYKETDS